MSSNIGDQWQTKTTTHLVVKHGFFHEPPTSEVSGGGLSRRIASDSALWCKGMFNDEDTDDDCEAVRPMVTVPESNSGSDNETDVPSSSKSGTFSAGEPAVECLNSGVSTPTDEDKDKFDMKQLLLENQRLASENEKLKASASQASQAQVFVPSNSGSGSGELSWPDSRMPPATQEICYHVAQPGVMWVPCNFAVPAADQSQMAFYSMYGMGNEQMMDSRGDQRAMRHNNGNGGSGVPSHVQRRMRSHKAMYDDDKVTDVPIEERTTVMLRNLPNNYNREMLLQMMDSEGFEGQYDFVYLPIDFRTHSSLGYAFINLVEPSVVLRFWNTFDGYSNWVLPSRKECFVSWCGPHQGFEAHVDRYRSSPVMHTVVPDEYKPAIFKNGVRVEFPDPTKKPRMPRVRNYVRHRA